MERRSDRLCTAGRQYDMEHGNGELRTAIRTGGDAFLLCLCERLRRGTTTAFRRCRPRCGATSTRRAPQIASPLFHFILVTTLQSTLYTLQFGGFTSALHFSTLVVKSGCVVTKEDSGHGDLFSSKSCIAVTPGTRPLETACPGVKVKYILHERVTHEKKKWNMYASARITSPTTAL